ncbi:hypothetical protein M514_07838 [Trichuris suis]|uniref:Uncharacterized protein n=1 Tax=Trichuris suis TaxID=68888 RepID=A0A085M1Z2_9BILA|nr:hypothetical protein M513_07838 [Trichuris suis]KFD64676.1 hypothetical protein M514_07838 [Trichuris suis]
MPSVGNRSIENENPPSRYQIASLCNRLSHYERTEAIGDLNRSIQGYLSKMFNPFLVWALVPRWTAIPYLFLHEDFLVLNLPERVDLLVPSNLTAKGADASPAPKWTQSPPW